MILYKTKLVWSHITRECDIYQTPTLFGKILGKKSRSATVRCCYIGYDDSCWKFTSSNAEVSFVLSLKLNKSYNNTFIPKSWNELPEAKVKNAISKE